MNGDKSTVPFCGKICTPFIKNLEIFETIFPLTCPSAQRYLEDLGLPEGCLSIEIALLSALYLLLSGGAVCYFQVILRIVLGCCSLLEPFLLYWKAYSDCIVFN